MRRYQSSCQERELLPSEYLMACRTEYVGCVFALLVEAGSALVEVAAIGDDFSVCLVRCCRQSYNRISLVLPLSDFLGGLERGFFVVC